WPLDGFDLLSVPVGLPRQRVPVEQALHHDHLPVEAAGGNLTGRAESACRADVHAPLRVLRRAVAVPEVVVDVGVVEVGIGRRELMTVVGLQRKEPRVVDPDLVTGLDALNDGGSGRDVNRVADRFELQAHLTPAVRGNAAERGGLARCRSAGDY